MLFTALAYASLFFINPKSAVSSLIKTPKSIAFSNEIVLSAIAPVIVSFPKIDEEVHGLLLVTYLLASNKKIIEEVSSIARQRGINITTIETLVSAYIPRNTYVYEGLEIGRFEDFKKNIRHCDGSNVLR